MEVKRIHETISHKTGWTQNTEDEHLVTLAHKVAGGKLDIERFTVKSGEESKGYFEKGYNLDKEM
jgi:hypothetical protein